MTRMALRFMVLLAVLALPAEGRSQPQERATALGVDSPGAVAVLFILVPDGGDELSSKGLLTLDRADGTDEPPIELSVDDGGEAEVRLPPETTWRLSVRVPGFWAPDGALRIGLEAKRVSVPLLPTGEVRGRLVRPQSAGRLPDQLEVSLESPRANARPRRVAAGRFSCPIEKDGSWRCELPAEMLDFVMRIDGFVPVYRWDVRVVAHAERDLGTIRLEPGSSVAGWVVREDREPLPDGVEARLVPRIACGPDTGLAARIRQGADTHEVGEDGFFQFRGVAAGTYLVLVDAPGFATATAGPFGVREADETFLRQPAVLRPPVDLVLEVEPPTDFEGRPWLLSASRASESTNEFDRRPIFDGSVSEGGRIVLRDQAPGRYELSLRDVDGNVFWEDSSWSVDTAQDAVRRIEIPRIVVQGQVTLGDDPLKARIWFGGRMGARRIAIESDDEGLFDGVLPKDGEWWVEVSSRESAVKHSLWVEVAPDDEGVATVDLSLPDTELSGVVLGPDEHPLPRASLSIDHAGGGTTTASAGPDGRFRVRGLPPGEIQVVAFSGASPQTASVAVEAWLEEGVETGPIVLRLVETHTVEGMVVAGGAPVAGAAVQVMPDGGGTGASALTDVTGRFTLELRSDARSARFEVAPPRGGLTAVRADLSGGAPVVIDTGTDWGAIRVLLPEEFDEQAHPVLHLFQDEIPLSSQTLVGWLRSNGLPSRFGDARELTLPRMAPGAYRACFGAPGGDPSCTAGYLSPGASLELSLR